MGNEYILQIVVSVESPQFYISPKILKSPPFSIESGNPDFVKSLETKYLVLFLRTFRERNIESIPILRHLDCGGRFSHPFLLIVARDNDSSERAYC